MSTTEQIIAALEPYKLKRDGANKYRCNSPLRPGSDSHAFTLVINGPEHGAFQDFVSGESGSLYDLARYLGIAIPTVTPITSTKRAYAGIEDYARTHGVQISVLHFWQWRETIHQGRPALEIPTASGNRWRFLDGDKPHFISPPGYRRCWYGLNQRVLVALDNNKPLVLCNGEISTVVAQHYGLAAVAITGGEKAEIPDDLLAELKGKIGPARQIIIAMDCDKTGRMTARGLETQLREAGYDALAVDLGLGTGGDLADFCTLHQDDALRELLKLPGLPPVIDTTRWQFASVDDVLNLPPIDWLIPRQLPARGLSMLYGASGSFKSFLILDMALKLALDNHNVLYIAAEGEHGYRQRLEAWIKHHDAKPRNITFVLGQVDLFNSEELTEFARLVERYKPHLVVVDTFAMCSGEADENSSRDMLTIVSGCKTMSRSLDCALVIVHHTNAEGKKERGSKILRNSCDTVLRVSVGDDVIVVESQKTKDTAPFETYYLKEVIVPLGYQNNLGEEVSSLVLLPSAKVIRTDALTVNQRAILAALAVQPNASIAELANITEIENAGSISRALTALVKKGLLQISGGSRELTDAGRQALDTDDTA